MTSRFLSRAGAAASIAAGVIFIGVQVRHPHLDVRSITTPEMAIRGSLKILMAAFALAGIAGMYVSEARRNALLGLIGYLALSAGYLAIMCTAFVGTVVLPSIAQSEPAYVQSVLDAATGGTAGSEIGAMGIAFKLQTAGYLVGGLVFGIALFRARVLARWASALLAAGGVVTAVLSLMPDPFYRLLAFPNGVAMIGLGVSLWGAPSSTAGTTAAQTAP